MPPKDGETDVPTTPLERLAEAIIAAAGDVGYDIRPGKRTGDKQRLALDAGVDAGQLSRLISAQRMPGIEVIAAICDAIKLDARKLFSEIQAGDRTQNPPSAVRSRPLTPDEVADAWGVTDPVGREEVRAMHQRLRRTAPAAATHHEGEQAQAD